MLKPFCCQAWSVNHLVIAEEIKWIERGSLCLCLASAPFLLSLQGQLVLAPHFLQASQSHVEG